MKCIKCKVYVITDDKTLDQFVQGLEPIIGQEILKENPQTFEEVMCQQT